MKTERPPQFLRFITGKIRHDHGDLEHLFLEERHPKRAAQDRLETRIEIRDPFAAGPAREIRMHHVALDRTGPNDRDLDHDIVKTFWLHPRERGHLGAALDLKNADRVGVLHHLVGRRVIRRDVGQIEGPAALAAKLERILHHRHHPEPEQVHFHDAKIFAIVLVPLRHDTPRHRGIFQRHKGTQFPLANDHAARMLAEMPRQSVNGLIERDERRHARMGFRQTGLLDLRHEIERVREIAVPKKMREPI